MSKNITQYELLISCPGDVKREVEIIKEVVNKFNSEFSKTLGIMIQERYWEEDSYPASGDKPQAILNKQFVDDCDAAVAIFWTRFGTPTDKYGSGTEEEIEKMIAANKQVFMYFSDVAISTSETNREQYEKIQEFKKKYKDKGLYWEYKTIEEFKDLFYAHLTKHFLTLSKVEEIENAKTPELEVELIDVNAKQLSYKFKNPDGLITYRRLSEEDIFDAIAEYVTIDDINEYNDALPDEEVVNTFNKQQKLYENSQNNRYDFKLLIGNVGNVKANEIYVDLYLPPEILVYNIDRVKLIKEPDKKPDMPKNPIWKAIQEKEKKKMKAWMGKTDALTRADTLIRQMSGINGLGIGTAYPIYTSSPFKTCDFSLPRAVDYSVKDNEELTLHIESLLHTREYESDKFSLIFTTYGEFEIKYSVMCEEWEVPIEGQIKIKVE